MKHYNLILAGLGGQGVMTISQVLAAAASREGVEVKLFEGTGITQRGGGVFSFVRFGEAYSPKIPVGEGDALVCLEISEIESVINYLKSQGQIWANTGRIHGYYTKLHPELYPTQEEIEAMIRLRTSHVHMLPADQLAQEAGSPQAVNMVMLGAFSSGNSLLKKESLTWAIEETNRRFATANLAAFRKGYDFVHGQGRGVS
jgi:indolepyruvate ferredoxin oxidoreductase beta subunit